MLTIEELEQIHTDHCEDAEMNLYLLADHAGLPELSRKLRENGIVWTNVFGDDRRPELTAASPLLFEVSISAGKPTKRQLLQWLNEHGRFSWSLLLIASRLELRDLAKGLAKRCDGVLSEGEAIVIRYFDTRVFPQLMEVMAEDERSTWLGIASHWWFIDRDGEITHLTSTSSDVDRFQSPMHISDDQMSRLLEASEIDQVAYLLETRLPEQFLRMHPVDRYRLLQDKMANARELGLSVLGDYALYCGLAFLHGADFDTQTQWLSVFSRVKSGATTLAQAVELTD